MVRLLIVTFTLVLAACGGGGGTETVTAPRPQLGPPLPGERDISPVLIDPQVNTSTEPHVVISPLVKVAPANKLFVFLPGTDGVPDMYRLVLRSGASRGFHALGLNYPNPTAVGSLCTNRSDANCYWDVRREIITGADYSALVAVNNANSVVTRLTKAISYLQQNYPDEGWSQFLVNGGPNWPKIVVAGHSQGGGHAGVMAKLYPMSRVVYFASPADFSRYFNAPAAWTSLPNATTALHQYGFTHIQDPLVPYNEVFEIWQMMGLAAYGSPVSIDSGVPPYSSSHILTTRTDPYAGGSVSPLHGATVLDAATPVGANGLPIFESAWAYLCFQ